MVESTGVNSGKYPCSKLALCEVMALHDPFITPASKRHTSMPIARFGIILSLALIIFRTTQPHTAVLGKIPGRPHYKNVKRFEQLEVRDELLIFRFDARLYFANVSFFKESIEDQAVKENTRDRCYF